MALGFIKELVGPVTGLVSEFIEDKDQVLKQTGVVVSSKPSHNYGPSAG